MACSPSAGGRPSPVFSEASHEKAVFGSRAPDRSHSSPRVPARTADRNGCSAGTAPDPDGSSSSRSLPSSFTGVRFENRLHETQERNVFTYRNYYNGGGVAIGDLNGDGLPEIVLTANETGPRLYLNAGGLPLSRCHESGGTEDRTRDSWTTGVALADVNGDGRLDIYIARAGPVPARAPRQRALDQPGPRRRQSCRRSAKWPGQYGVADEGYTTHAAFLDYDRDGDLDLFVINNSPRPASSFGLRNTRHVRDAIRRQRSSIATTVGASADVSATAGIHGRRSRSGSASAVGDVNRDGWPDIYVANDFFERDYLYVNNRQRDVRRGARAADADAQLLLDGPGHRRRGQRRLARHLHHGHAAGGRVPAQDDDAVRGVGRLPAKRPERLPPPVDAQHAPAEQPATARSATSARWPASSRTDWSWSALIADLDLDGLKDIYVTNGLAKDLTSQDYVAFLANEETMETATDGRTAEGRLRPSSSKAMTLDAAPDFAFRNEGTGRVSPTRRSAGGSTRPTSRTVPRTAIWMATARSTWW